MTSDTTRRQFIEHARAARSLVESLDLDADLADMAPLAAIVGEARVVGIGESWHSAGPLLRFRQRMVRYLVERKGFDLLVFEGSVAGAAEIDDFVKGGAGDAALVLRKLEQAMWLNRESADFLRWLRQHNATVDARRKVSVSGMDSVPPTAALASVPAYLDRVDPHFVVPSRDLVDRVAAAFAAIPLSSTSRAAIWGATEVYAGFGESDRERLRASFLAVFGRLSEMRRSYEAASSATQWRWIMRHAMMVLQAGDILAARLASPREANHLRDLAFSENVAWLLEHGHPCAKAVLFGHNIHMAKESFRSFDSDERVTSLGERLAQWYGDGYVAIGSAVGTGAFARMGPGLVDLPAEDNPRRKSSLGSIDAALEEVGAAHFLLAMPEVAWTAASQPMRSHLNPATDYIPARAFDALAYVDGIVGATPIA